VVDLGAGYGRLGFVLQRHFPEVEFLGLELVAERVREGQAALQRFGAGNARLVVADLADPAFRVPEAAVYFIYDFGVRAAIAKVLDEMRGIAGRRAITVVGRGRAIRDQIERGHPWLGEVNPPFHRPHFSIYCS
jgi:hypothetical protein